MFYIDGGVMMNELKKWLKSQIKDCTYAIEEDCYFNVLDYLDEHELIIPGTCQHIWGLMHPISPDNQKYVCLNCDEVK